MTTYNTGNPVGSTAVKDLYDNAENLDQALNDTDAATWTDRLGRERRTYGEIERLADPGTALAAAERAELAATAAMTSGRVFPDTSSGIAATSDGAYFSVPSVSDEGYLDLYRRSDGAAVYIDTYPNKTSIDNAIDEVRLSQPRPAFSIAQYPDARFAQVGEDGVVLVAWDSARRMLFASDALALGFVIGGYPDAAYARVTEDGLVLEAWTAGGHLLFQDGQSGLSAFSEDGTAVAARVDDQGVVSEFIEPEGGVWSPGEVAFALPYEHDKVVRAFVRGEDAFVGFADGVKSMRGIGPQRVQAVIRDPNTGQSRACIGRVGGPQLVPTNKRRLYMFCMDGQSNSEGAQGYPRVTLVNPYPTGAFMFGPDVRMGLGSTEEVPFPLVDPASITELTPIIAMPGATGTIGFRGETPAERLAIHLSWAASVAGADFASVWFCVGKSGQPYEAVMKGTNPYQNRLLAVARIMELGAAMGYTEFVYGGTFWRGGESATDETIEEYKAKMVEHDANIAADVMPITSQRFRPLYWMTQSSTFFSPATASPYLAMLELHKESPYHILLGPDYPYPYSTNDGRTLHLSGPSNARCGATHAPKIMSLSKSYDPILIETAERTGTKVRLTYRPIVYPPLAIDTTLVTERDVRGFRYRDGATYLTIKSVTLESDGTGGVPPVLSLELATTPSGVNEAVEYALNGHSGTRDPSTIPRGNVRDSAGAYQPLVESFPLHNWSAHQAVPVSVL